MKASVAVSTVSAADLQQRVAAFLAAPDLNAAAFLAIDMGASGDVAWVPYLIDLLRLAGQEDGTEQIMGALQALTGRYVLNDATVAFVEYGGWALANGPQPAPGYGHWKRTLYGPIDPSFAIMLSGIADPMLLSEIHWGGIVRGGIPELNRPARTRHGEAAAAYLTADELVFGLVMDGAAVAYPERIMGYHELANDVVNGRDLVISYCPLCRSARAHGAGGSTMQTSGLLRHSNKLMVARVPPSSAPDTALATQGSEAVAPLAEAEPVLWQQQSGLALSGAKRGTRLEEFPIETLTWQQWRDRYPASEVLALPDRDRYPDQSYEYEPGGAYRGYDLDAGAWFPVLATPGNLPLKATVITLLGAAIPGATTESASAALAIELQALARAGPTVIAWPAAATAATARTIPDGLSELILAVPVTNGAHLYRATGSVLAAGPAKVTPLIEADRAVLPDGSILPRLTAGRATWFAWYGEHRSTTWWPV